MTRECPRSTDVVAAVMAGAFDGRDDGELQRHLEECRECADVMAVMSALRAERARARPAVPSAGLIWWRAQLRQRQEAARAAAAPITALHVLTLALALGLAGFLLWTVARMVGMPDLSAYVPSPAAWMGGAGDAEASWSFVRYGLVLAAAAWLTLGPVALYLALRRD
jgi:hypothetical protein